MAKRRKARRTAEASGDDEGKSRAMGPEGYDFNFIDAGDAEVQARASTSPWRPIVKDFLESDLDCLEIKVNDKIDGRNLTNRLREVFHQIINKDGNPNSWKIATRVVKYLDGEGQEAFKAYIFVTVDDSDE